VILYGRYRFPTVMTIKLLLTRSSPSGKFVL